MPYFINPHKVRKRKRRGKKKNPLLTIANRGPMAKRRKRRNVRRHKRSAGVRRQIVVMRANPGHRKSVRRYGKRRHRRNPARVASLPRPVHLLKNSLAVIGGFAAPSFVEPLLPFPAATPGGMLLKRAAAGVVAGFAGNLLTRFRLINRQTANFVWLGVGVNFLAAVLKSYAGISVPGFTGYGAYPMLSASNDMAYMAASQAMPE